MLTLEVMHELISSTSNIEKIKKSMLDTINLLDRIDDFEKQNSALRKELILLKNKNSSL